MICPACGGESGTYMTELSGEEWWTCAECGDEHFVPQEKPGESVEGLEDIGEIEFIPDHDFARDVVSRWVANFMDGEDNGRLTIDVDQLANDIYWSVRTTLDDDWYPDNEVHWRTGEEVTS